MPSNRNIVRGTFRLSLVATVLAAAYGLYLSMADYIRAYPIIQGNAWVKATLECGSRISDDELKTSLNEDGSIDLSKVSTKSILCVPATWSGPPLLLSSVVGSQSLATP